MAETPTRTSFKKYYSIFQGKFVRRVEKGTEGAITRKNKQEKEVHELHFDSITGLITGIEIEQTDFGKQYKISMSDIGEEMIVSVAVDSSFGDSLMSKILNLNPEVEVEIKPYSFTTKDTGKKREGLNLFQGGNKIEYFFTKEKPNGKPQPQGEGMDSDDWKVYNIQVRKFYAKVLEQKVVPMFKAKVAPPTIPPVAPTQDDDDSGLPF